MDIYVYTHAHTNTHMHVCMYVCVCVVHLYEGTRRNLMYVHAYISYMTLYICPFAWDVCVQAWRCAGR